jgi:hypothetical protein
VKDIINSVTGTFAGFFYSVGIATGSTLVQLPIPDMLQYGALGLTGMSLVGLFMTIYHLIRGYNELAKRWDGWEKLRHADSTALRSELAALRQHCAEQNAHHTRHSAARDA